MDFLFDLIMELVAEGTVGLSRSIKVPKYIGFLLIVLIVLFFLAVIGIVLFTGLLIIKEAVLPGVLFIGLALSMLISGIIKFRKTYLHRK